MLLTNGLINRNRSNPDLPPGDELTMDLNPNVIRILRFVRERPADDSQLVQRANELRFVGNAQGLGFRAFDDFERLTIKKSPIPLNQF